MSSHTSYGSSHTQDKGASYAPSSSSTSTSSSLSRSIYANSAQTSRQHRYGSKPPKVINGGGQSSDTNTSTSAPNSGYYD